MEDDVKESVDDLIDEGTEENIDNVIDSEDRE